MLQLHFSRTLSIMVDTGATGSYVCTDLIAKLGIKTVRREQHCIEQMYGTIKKTVEVDNITIKLSVQFNNPHVQNPKITRIKNQIQEPEVYPFKKKGKHKIYFSFTSCLVLLTTNEFKQMSHCCQD